MTAITDMNQLDFSKNYTYADYLTWHFKEKIELIKGKIIAMSPAPTRRHQDIAQNINRILDNFFIKSLVKCTFRLLTCVCTAQARISPPWFSLICASFVI